MPAQVWVSCRQAGCSERAISFSEFCWAHTNKESYRATLVSQMGRHTGPSLSLNLKKVECQDIDFVNLDLQNSSLSQARLTNVQFIGSDLSECDMIGARFRHCDFVGSSLKTANMTRAVFEHCSFSHSDLTGANLTESHFREADFMGASLHGALIWNADISGARYLKKKNFASGDGGTEKKNHALSESDPQTACESYRLLKHYLYGRGLYEDASWASYRELTMERKHFFKTRNPRFLPSLLMDILSGYTEKPNRVIVASLAIILFFALTYFLFSVPLHGASGEVASIWDCLYYSFITFTTVGYGDFTPRPEPWFRMLACAEAFSGPFMAGLYVFTLTRRYAAG